MGLFFVKKPAGYSGTSLAKKLGIKQGCIIRVVNFDEDYFSLFSDLPPGMEISENAKTKKDFIHYFETRAKQLAKLLPALKKEMKPDGMIWISWYKKSAKNETDITEDIIRDIALKNGLVDVKVCAVTDEWSGLKLVIPLKDRKK